ncbi:hypothetical protein T265_02732 [Opisthorchis viverrini]|uniref:Uncharacterized protein n=1 Tax=Opisthorchis viverrini TaxID=6198 RepID=A0A074ZTW1_OPIVI|nr:hypothetical protein T265_02732 [Opisthorchis viverrini]KER30918.1 hypothetical protein T265_02732 [Opisthorchis viverrini]
MPGSGDRERSLRELQLREVRPGTEPDKTQFREMSRLSGTEVGQDKTVALSLLRCTAVLGTAVTVGLVAHVVDDILVIDFDLDFRLLFSGCLGVVVTDGECDLAANHTLVPKASMVSPVYNVASVLACRWDHKACLFALPAARRMIMFLSEPAKQMTESGLASALSGLFNSNWAMHSDYNRGSEIVFLDKCNC